MQAWSSLKIRIAVGTEDEEDSKIKKTSLDPVKMQFIYQKDIVKVSHLKQYGLCDIKDGVMCFKYPKPGDIKELMNTVTEMLETSIKDVAIKKLTASKWDIIEKCSLSKDNVEIMSKMKAMFVVDEAGKVTLCGTPDHVDLVMKALELRESSFQQREEFLSFRDEFHADLFTKLVCLDFKDLTSEKLSGDQIWIKVTGAASEVDKCQKIAQSFKPVLFSSQLEHLKICLLRRKRVVDEVNEEIDEAKLRCVWRVEKEKVEVYALTDWEAKQGFREIDSAVQCIEMNDNEYSSERIKKYFNEHEQVIHVTEKNGKQYIYSTKRRNIEILELCVASEKDEVEVLQQAVAQSSLEGGSASQDTTASKRMYKLSKEEYMEFECLKFTQFVEQDIGYDFMCTLAPNAFAVEFFGKSRELDRAERLVDVFRESIKRGRLEVLFEVGQHLHKPVCRKYVTALIDNAGQNDAAFWFVSDDNMNVHISSTNPQTVIIVRDLIKSAVVHCNQAVTGEEYDMFGSEKWQNFLTRSKGKVQVYGLEPATEDYLVISTSDLHKEMQELLESLRKTQMRERLPLGITVEEVDWIYRSLKGQISQLEKEFQVKIRKDSAAGIVYVEGTRDQCYKMKDKFDQKFWKNTFDLQNPISVDFVHSRQGEEYINSLQKTYACCVSTNNENWNREPVHVYDFRNEDKGVHVSLMKGSVENMKVDMLMCPVNNCLIPIEKGQSIEEKGEIKKSYWDLCW